MNKSTIRICIVTGGGEPSFCSGQGLIYGFRQLGLEVISLGPSYWGRQNNDIEVPDKKHPELYSYEFVLSQLPWTPDIIGQISPHFYLHGEKPKEIQSFYYDTDQHATGHLFYSAAKWGSFDFLFVGQPAFKPLFDHLAPKVEVVIPACDERRFDKNLKIEPEVDLSFVGNSGLHMPDWQIAERDDAGPYFSRICDRLPHDSTKYASGPPSYDYCERGELFYRLSQDFNVRLYGPIWDEESNKYQLALMKGKIGLNRSCLNDTNLRIFESLASGRVVFTEENQSTRMLPELQHSAIKFYNDSLYKPFYRNYDLLYYTIANQIEETLSSPHLREWQDEGQEYTFRYHRWTNRAETILKYMGLS